MNTDTQAPPVAKRIPVTTTFHGDTRTDEFAWLREKENPDVIAHLTAENSYAEASLAHTLPLQKRLYEEMLGHIQQTDLSVPYRDGEWWYFSRTQEGQQYPILCRRHESGESSEELLLDLNELAKGHPFLALGAYRVSDDGRYLAYSTDTTGFRQYTLRVKDLTTGELLPASFERSGSVAWAADNRTVFFTVEDEGTKRQYQLMRHRLGELGVDVVYEEQDELFRVGIMRPGSKRWLVLLSASHTTTENRLLAAGDPGGEWRVVEPRRHEHEYFIAPHLDHLYIRTNDAGHNFRLVRASDADPGQRGWEEVIAHRANAMLEDLDVFERFLVLEERENGLQTLRIIDLEGGESHHVAFPEPAYMLGSGQNMQFSATAYRYTYQSLVTPNSVFDYDLERRESQLLKQTPVPGYEPELYRSERLEAVTSEGVRVPVSLVYREGSRANGPAPLLLYGYGSYGYPLPITFSANRLSLLDRGVIFAMAHVRGGGEMGKAWHEAGRMAFKMNTFTDFIAVAEHLVAEGYTSPDRLVIEGGSAGGLLMGAVTNLRPDLFRAVIAHVPFADVLNTMLDASLPLTIGEYEEWGNPNRPEEYEWMRSYCPYTNLADHDYPAMLVRTALNDSQVMYWEPAKYVARLRSLKTDSNPLLFVTNMGAGHGGASGRYDYLKEIALDYAFLLWQLGYEG
ncbi:protease 2 [bacterium SCGC AG-212-C10]|nr:protease 2 [bacterium SCGC AG-212-C10]